MVGMIRDPLYSPFRRQQDQNPSLQWGMRRAMEKRAEEEALRMHMAQQIKQMDRGGTDQVGGAVRGFRSAASAAPSAFNFPNQGGFVKGMSPMGPPIPTTQAPGMLSKVAGAAGKAMGPIGMGMQAYGLIGGLPQSAQSLQQMQQANPQAFQQQMAPALGHDAVKQGLLGIGSGVGASAGLGSLLSMAGLGSGFGPIGSVVGGLLGALMGAAPSAYGSQQTLGTQETAKQMGLGGANFTANQLAGNQAMNRGAGALAGSKAGAFAPGAAGLATATGPFGLLAFTPKGRDLFGKAYEKLKDIF